uniref:Fibrinogen C-terminal domain-containing protein n=1 Tax=Anopheles atroparvus TaxID=41427 RepID=A0A182IR74_ANOAO
MLQFLLTQLETMESRMLSTIDGRMHQLQKSIEERLGIIEKKTKRVLRRLRKDSICPENDAGTVVNEETSTVRTMDQLELMESRIISTLDERISQLERNIDHKIQNAVEIIQQNTKRIFRTFRKYSIEEQNGISRLSNKVRNALVSGEQRLARLQQVDEIKRECSDVKYRLETLSGQLVNLTSTSAAHASLILGRMDKLAMRSGVYAFRSRYNHSLWVYRDSTNNHGFGSGWIVIQRRYAGRIDFNRSWAEYCNGFGNVNGEHWLGLRNVHEILKTGRHDLLFVFEYRSGMVDYAHYDNFVIGDVTEQYVLKSLGKHSGNLVFRQAEGTKFSTYDKESGLSCPKALHRGWWLKSCTEKYV